MSQYYTYTEITPDHWAYKTRGKHHYISNTGRVFETEEAARQFCDLSNAWADAMAQVRATPEAPTRAEYEQACVQLGVPAMPDAACTSYGVRHGDFRPEECGIPHCVTMALAKRRLWALEQEATQQPPVAPPPVDLVRASCGHTVSRAVVMSASLGTACPACYDRLSD